MTLTARLVRRGRWAGSWIRPGGAPWAGLVLAIGLVGLVATSARLAPAVWFALVLVVGQLPLLLPRFDPEAGRVRRGEVAQRSGEEAAARSEQRAARRREAQKGRLLDPEAAAERRVRARACIVAGATWSVLLVPVLWRVAHGPITGYLFSDWHHHLRLVHRFQLEPIRVPLPHFLFELNTRVLVGVTSLSLETAGTIVATVFVGFTGAALAWFFQRPWVEGGRRPAPWLAAGCSVAFVLAELPQFTFFGTGALRDDVINASIHQWNTPSTVTAESFQILLFAGAVTALTQRWPVDRTARWLPLLVVVAMLAKPSVPLVIGAAMLPWLLRGKAPRWAWRRGILCVTVPVGIMVLVQLLIGAYWWEPEAPASLAIHVGGVFRSLDLWGPGLGVLILPILALVTGGREVTRNPAARLAGWALVAGVIAAGSIVETGLRAADGNVARTAFGGYWILYICLLRWVLELWLRREEWATWTVARRAGAVLLAVYVALCMVAGTGLYLEEIGLISFTGARG